MGLACSLLLIGLGAEPRSARSSAWDRAQRTHGSGRHAGSWEYRYGDSPVDASGRLWSKPESAEDHSGWQPTTLLETPPGRGGASFLWLRTRIVPPPGYPLPSSAAGNDTSLTLYAYNIDASYEAYLDGVLIALRCARSAQPSFLWHAAHLFAVGPRQRRPAADAAHLLSPMAGLACLIGWYRLAERVVQGGARSQPLSGLGRRLLDLPGDLGLRLVAARRGEWVYFYYGAFAFSAGINLIMRAPARDLFLPPGPLWTYAELLSPVGVTTALCGYMALVFGAGPYRIVNRLGQAMLGITAVGIVLVGLESCILGARSL